MKLGSGLLRIRMMPSQQPASLCNAVTTESVSVSAVLLVIITHPDKNASIRIMHGSIIYDPFTADKTAPRFTGRRYHNSLMLWIY